MRIYRDIGGSITPIGASKNMEKNIMTRNLQCCRGERSSTASFGYCPPLTNRWIINIIGLYIALHRTPNIDCYWGGGGGTVPKASYVTKTSTA